MTYSQKNAAWGRMQDGQERHARESVTDYAKTIQNETGCTWGEAIRVAEERVQKEGR